MDGEQRNEEVFKKRRESRNKKKVIMMGRHTNCESCSRRKKVVHHFLSRISMGLYLGIWNERSMIISRVDLRK